MSLASFSVRRPVFIIMFTLIVIILGGICFFRLPIDLMPDISYPTITVSTTYQNAAPEEMEELVTQPIEEAMSAVPGAEEVSSVSAEGISNVRVSFGWGADMAEATNDVRDRLDRVISHLPDEADRPSLRKFDPASFPILVLGAYSSLDPVQMRVILDTKVKYRLERVPGVAALDIWGGLEREIQVNVHPDKLKALGLSLDEVVNRITAGNVNLPAGTIDRGNYAVTIRTPGEYVSLDEVRSTAVAVREGVPIELKEIASVQDRWQKIRQYVRVNGQPGIRVAVNKQSGTNTVEVAQRVLKEVAQINQDLPQIHLTPMSDSSDYIKRSITSVGNSALYGGLYAILVLFFFLRNIRSTAIIATAIPISIIATLVLMYFAGFTLNIMTLGGLALGVGMLVDNAIVVLENIYRLRESGAGAEVAALHGSDEVTNAIVASTLTTVVVFLPLVFVRGMAGVLFKQLAFVVGFALMCSMVVALTLVPMLAAKILHPATLNPGPRESWSRRLFRVSGRLFAGMAALYERMLRFCLGHRKLVVAGTAGLLLGCAALIPLVGVELMPASDEGEVRVDVEMEVGTRLDVLDQRFRTVEAVVKREVPEAKTLVVSVGGGGWRAGGSNAGSMTVALKPQAERSRSSDQIAADLRVKLRDIPGLTIRTRAGRGMSFMRMGMGGTERVQIEVRGHDLATADVLAAQVKKVVEQVPGVTDARVSRESGAPEELILIDRQKAEEMKLSVSQIANMLQTVLSGTQASYYREGGSEYGILVKNENSETMNLRDILDMTLPNADGELVVLRNVAYIQPRSGPIRIERDNQERIITVSANIYGRDMGSILADVRERLPSVPKPRDFSIVLGGEYEEQKKAFNELLVGFVLSLILVYMVMACLYESLRDPFVVMFSVPLGGIGVVLMLFLSHTTFNVQSFIGCIMLGGIVVNNAIVLVDHTNLLRRRDGMPLQAAIEEAGRRRLRPILMTSLTTILGLLPLALGLGEGGETQAPLARAVIGGLTSATFITLLFIPVIYSLFEGRAARKTAQPSHAASAQEARV